MGAIKKNHPPTLCWSCQNTNRFKCSWFNPDNPQPVPGWTAELRRVKGIKGDSYCVTACPNFLPLPQATETETAHKPAPEKDHVLGVSRTGDGRWQARIYWRRRSYYLGYYENKQEAVAARKAAEKAIKRGEPPCRNK